MILKTYTVNLQTSNTLDLKQFTLNKKFNSTPRH